MSVGFPRFGYSGASSAASASPSASAPVSSSTLTVLSVTPRHLDDEVDHLVLEDRRLQGLHGLRAVPVELEDLRRALREHPRLFRHRAGQLVLADADVVGPADLGQQQREPHPALRDALVAGAQIVVRQRLVILVESVLFPGLPDLAPDRVELPGHHAGGQLEGVLLGPACRAGRA